MQKWFLSLFILFAVQLFSHVDRQTICLNMIVKDEAHVIKRSLASAKPWIDYWVIVDTGSTDGTQEIIREFMKDIPGELHESPWVHFEYNRNEALDLARDKAEYLLFIDADEEFIWDEGFEMPYLDRDYYFITTIYGGSKYQRNQLIRSDLDWSWVGVVHEVLCSNEARSVEILPGFHNFVRNEGARSLDPTTFLKDAILLENALFDDPENSRYTFYLAQSYRDGGANDLAMKYYKRRIEMGGWDEEVYCAKYQFGLLLKKQGIPIDELISYFSDVYSFRPTRAEPLYQIARAFRLNGDYLMGYLVANFASKLPYPEEDILLIENWIYDYDLAVEKSVCAYWLGKYDECLNISQELLSRSNLPDYVKECVEQNVFWAISELSSENYSHPQGDTE